MGLASTLTSISSTSGSRSNSLSSLSSLSLSLSPLLLRSLPPFLLCGKYSSNATGSAVQQWRGAKHEKRKTTEHNTRSTAGSHLGLRPFVSRPVTCAGTRGSAAKRSAPWVKCTREGQERAHHIPAAEKTRCPPPAGRHLGSRFCCCEDSSLDAEERQGGMEADHELPEMMHSKINLIAQKKFGIHTDARNQSAIDNVGAAPLV